MTHRGRRGLAVCALLVVAAPACGTTATNHASARAGTTGSYATTTVGSTSTTAPYPVVRLRGPRVVVRGSDLGAVARSLLAYRRWIEAEDPDPALVDRVCAWHSDVALALASKVAVLRRTGRRIVEVDAAPLGLVMVSRLANDASFHVTEHLARRDLVDTHGKVLVHAGPATEYSVVFIFRPWPDAPWRVNLVTRTPSSFEMW